MSTNTERLRRALEAVDAHDTETRRMHREAMETGSFPPAGTFPAREERRRVLSVTLEEAARSLLAESGVYVTPGRAS